MNILSIDTTADTCSIALVQADQQFVFHEHRPRAHAKILLPEIEQLVQQAQIKMSEIDLIVFGRGPGSFTGVRIATGVAQGLAFAIGCSVMPISTLQSLAFSARLSGRSDVLVAIDARMSEVYFARYALNEFGIPVETSAEAVIAPHLINEQTNEECIFVGNGWGAGYELPEAFNAEQLDNAISLPHALHSAQLAQLLISHGIAQPVSPDQAMPIYLRDNVTWEKKPKVGS